jgi:hypothetical protein
MSISPSKKSVERLYKIFQNPDDKMREILEEMLNPKAEPGVEGNIEINSPEAVLTLGFRRLLDVHIEKRLEDYKNHPFYDLILEMCQRKRLEFELQISIEYTSFVNNYGRVFHMQNIPSSAPWKTHLIEHPAESLASVNRFIDEIIGEKDSFFSKDGTSVTKAQVEYVRILQPTWQASKIGSFGDTSEAFREQWNNLLRTIFMKYVEEKLIGVSNRSKTKEILAGLSRLIGGIDFVHVLMFDLNEMMQFLSNNLLNTTVELSTTKIIKAKSVYRVPITESDLQNLLEVVHYPLAHHVVSEIAAERVKQNLIKQFKGVELEPAFIGRLHNYIADQFKKAIVPAGHRVGMIAAQAAGENASQAGLRSFHHAGISGGTGFDRINGITSMSKKNPFTTISLVGMPSRDLVYHYSHAIESTLVGDFCQFSIGKTRADISEPHEIFGDTPVYIAEPGGWQERFVKIDSALGVKKEGHTRPSMERPDWIVRIKCDSDFMVQNKISMADIAEAIENAFKDYRAITSDITEGLIDVYINTSSVGNTSEAIYKHLKVAGLRNVSTVRVKGLSSFEKTLVQKYSIIEFIDSVDQKGPDAFVRFSRKDIAYNGVPKNQIIRLLEWKRGPSASEISTENGYEYLVPQTNAKVLHKRLIEQEVVKLEDAILKIEESPDKKLLEIHLNRKMLRDENDVSVHSLSQFFSQQNTLRQFESVDIHFDRKTFIVTIGPSDSFNGETVLKSMRETVVLDDQYLQAASYEVSSVTITNLPSDLDVSKLETFVASYGSYVSYEVTKMLNEKVDIKLNLSPMDLGDAYKSLLNVVKDCNKTPTVFISGEKQKYSYRYRILAKGTNTLQLSTLSFVNIYASISSSPMEIFEHFDIEATQTYCYGELVLNAGQNVGNRHLGLLSDTLTYMGIPVKMDISGKKATEGGVMSTASFQQTFQVMLDSSSANMTDGIRGNVSMTLVGDFERAERTKVTHEDPRLDSAVERLMAATLFDKSYSGKPKEKPRRTRKVVKEIAPPSGQEIAQVIETNLSNLAEDYAKTSIL